MDNLDRMNSTINIALLDKCIGDMQRARQAEIMPGLSEQVKITKRTEAIQSMESAIKYLRGDFSLLTTQDLKKAKELEEKEPALLQVAEENEELRKLVEKLEKKYGVSTTKTKKTGTANDKPSSKKTATKKPSKRPAKRPIEGLPVCPKCGKEFKSKAGLGRHVKSCKAAD